MKKVKINCEALKKWVKEQDKTSAEMSAMLGKSKSYLSNVYQGYTPFMSIPMYELFLRTFNLPENSFKVIEMQQPNTEIKRPKEVPNGYWLNLKYSKTAVKVQLMFCDEVIMGGISKIKGDTLLDFAQAISYASHMVYKFLEQKQLQEKMGGQ